MSEAYSLPELAEPCVRCLTTNRNTVAVRFIWRGRCYEVALCPDHELLINRDFAVWARVGREMTMERQPASRAPEVSAPPSPAGRTGLGDPERRTGPDRREADRRMRVKVPLIVARGEVIDHDGTGADKPDVPTEAREIPRSVDPSEPLEGWAFSDHARQRMHEREISQGAVWRTLRAKSTIVLSTTTSGGQPAVKYAGPEATVVVSEIDRVVITVGRPNFNRAALCSQRQKVESD